MLRRALSVLALMLATAAAGCGGGLADHRADPSAREEEELQARHWYMRVVQLESETARAVEQGEECGRTCALAGRACELVDQICALARDDERDEGTALLCEDARPRCAAARGAAASRCPCPG